MRRSGLLRHPTICGSGRLESSAIFATLEEYVSGFYEFLRKADRRSISTIFVPQAPNQGIGQALLDRQRRAAGG